MESLKLDASGDLVMEGGELQTASGDDEVVQTFQGLWQTNKDEWFLDPDMGFDYSVVSGVKVIAEEALSDALQDLADQMEEIDRIEDIQINHNRQTRKAHIRCTAFKTDGGSVEIEEEF